MTDRELLELAARAAGLKLKTSPNSEVLWRDLENGCVLPWNPLTDDGDALRLAVKLRLNLNFEEWDGAEYACAVPHKAYQGQDEVISDDECDAARRAITRAAAEIWKGMQP